MLWMTFRIINIVLIFVSADVCRYECYNVRYNVTLTFSTFFSTEVYLRQKTVTVVTKSLACLLVKNLGLLITAEIIFGKSCQLFLWTLYPPYKWLQFICKIIVEMAIPNKGFGNSNWRIIYGGTSITTSQVNL